MSKKVLYIDDNQELLDAARMIFESKGYEMVEAHTGSEGLEVYKEDKFDLILIDLMMETVDAGVTFAAAINELGNTTPAYILSSVGEEFSGGINIQELGLSGAYQKPMEPKMLLGLMPK